MCSTPYFFVGDNAPYMEYAVLCTFHIGYGALSPTKKSGVEQLQSPQLSQRDGFVCSDILREPSRPITRPLAHPSSSHHSSSSGLATPGRSIKADMASHVQIELDLQPHNIGLNTAWMRAQDRSKWRQLVETAMLTDGLATRSMMMMN